MTDLTPKELKQIRDLLSALDSENGEAIKKLSLIIKHAQSVDEVVNVINSFGVVGRFLRKGIYWLIAIIAGILTLNADVRAIIVKAIWK